MTFTEIADISAWRIAAKEEVLRYLSEKTEFQRSESPKRGSLLVIRTAITTLDMYCYMKARFGEPNGFQNYLRRDDSNNWIHWEFLVVAESQFISFCGTSREIHVVISEKMSDENWHDLIQIIKNDFPKYGAQKSEVLRQLEKWVIFPNRYIQVADICADLFETIQENINGYQSYISKGRSVNEWKEQEEVFKEQTKRAEALYGSCIELSLLTPVLAEAFINMLILILCKRDIKNNHRQFDCFIRSHIDVKIFDLFYKCEGFIRPISPTSDEYKNFHKIMSKRNNTIHGNVNPENEKIEYVYFEGKRPLFGESGDHIGKFRDALERQHRPQEVMNEYIQTHLFLSALASNIMPEYLPGFWQVMEDSYPGYDYSRQMAGRLFPGHMVVGVMEGQKYDDELTPRVQA